LTSGHFVWSHAAVAIGTDAAENGCKSCPVNGVSRPFWAFRRRSNARLCSRAEFASGLTTLYADLQGFYGSDRTRTATSGVAGRYGVTSCNRLTTRNYSWSRHFFDRRTG
jgi:hypothetical protein